MSKITDYSTQPASFSHRQLQGGWDLRLSRGEIKENREESVVINKGNKLTLFHV
jgi:hypothetical protein